MEGGGAYRRNPMLEAFLAITRSGGFARGSAALHLSQPATSRRIKLLEAELGTPLFDRLGRGVSLTEAGRAFLPHAQALLASMRDGIDAVNAVRGTGHGTVTLALVGTLASSSLTARLSRLCQAHPGLDLRLQTAATRPWACGTAPTPTPVWYRPSSTESG